MNQTPAAPLEVQFTNTSTFYTSVVWDFGPGEGTSTLNNPVHFYSTPGTYLVKLLITSPGGCLDSAFHTIRLDDTAGSRVDYLPIGGCKPLDVNLNIVTAATISSYYWDFGDGNTATSTTPTTNHIYTSFGNFLPKVIMTDPSGCIIPLQGLDTVFVIGARANFGVDDSLFCDFGTTQLQISAGTLVMAALPLSKTLLIPMQLRDYILFNWLSLHKLVVVIL